MDTVGSAPISRRAVLAAAGGLAASAALGRSAYASAEAADPASKSGYVDVQLLNITDLHGYLQPPAPTDGGLITGAGGVSLSVGGIGYLATHLKRLREGWPNSIFYSAGDNFSGWPYYIDSQNNEPTIEALNALGLQFSSVGNHELDKGPEFLIEHMEQGRPYPFDEPFESFRDSTGHKFGGADWRYYSGNVLYKASGQMIVPPYNIEWVDAGPGRRLPIGFIHLTVKGFEGVGFNCSYQPSLTSIDEVATVNRYTAELKRRGVNAIIVCMHEGGYAGPDYNAGSNPTGPAFTVAAEASPDIAAIVTGHWHCRFNMMLPDHDGLVRPVVEAGYYGQVINELQLKLDRHTGEIVRELTVSINHAVTRDVPVDEELQGIADYWSAKSDQLYAVPLARQTGDLTRTANANGESALGNLIADFLVWDTRQTEHTHERADVGLVPTKPLAGISALRGDLPYRKGSSSSDEDGLILFGEAWNAYGYDSPIVTVTMTGAQLHLALEQQWQVASNGTSVYSPLAVSESLHYRFDLTAPIGRRIDPSKLTIHGKSLELTASYKVAANSYTILGQDGFSTLTVFENPVRHTLDKEGFIRFLRGRTITPPALDRGLPV